MKIVVNDNGLLDRADMEFLVSEIPAYWWKKINVLAAFSTSGNQLLMSYRRNEKALGIHVPDSYTGTRDHVLTELAITLQAISDYGVIPKYLTAMSAHKYLQRWKELVDARQLVEATN